MESTQIYSAGSGSVEDKINSLQTYDKDLTEIREYLIDKNITRIKSEGSKAILSAAIPSFILLILSFFVDVANVPLLGKVAVNFANSLFPGTQLLNQGVEPYQFWWLPILVYVIFILLAILCNIALRREITQKGLTEGSISRIIDRYSGAVDAIATALPLLGAAFLLVSIKEGPTIFLGFSVPFEIKSILILAIGKLFESVFDAQAVKYSEIQDEIKQVQTEYYAEKEASMQKAILAELSKGKIAEAPQALKGFDMKKEDVEQIYKVMEITNKISEAFAKNMATLDAILKDLGNSKLTDEKVLNQLQVTSQYLNETIKGIKDTNALKGLDNLVYLAGKR
ncbi:MAG: hypothetical protein JSS63_09710 [Bacteroidetes bacterium]|nr:hypothetical protein [Bacteroidota bacterium]MBX7046785.1 hypothetical protein [Ignavibacteria bacterium]